MGIQTGSVAASAEAGLGRKERERLMRREAILEAAIAVFAEKGYRTATLDEVAERAEFGKGTLYNYFPGGKEGLLFAIFDGLYESLHAHARSCFSPERVGHESFRSLLSEFVAQLFTFFFAHQDQVMVLLKEANRIAFSDEADKVQYFQNQEAETASLLEPAVAAAIASGELRPVSPRAAVRMILGNLDGYLRFRCYEQRSACPTDPAVLSPQSPDQAAAFITTLLLDGLGGQAGLSAVNELRTPLQENVS